VLALAISIAERVIKRRIEIDPALVADQLAAALALTVSPSRLAIRTSPDDLETAKTILPTLLHRFTESPNITIEPDPALSRGSVTLRTDKGEVDATIETQLDRIVEVILPARKTDIHHRDTESTEQEKKKGVGSGE
jgi:flagellar assembly protein FliH